MQRTYLTAGLAAIATLTAAASAQVITGASTADNSSLADTTWSHSTSVSPVTTAGGSSSFTHTATLSNGNAYTGGVAQVNKKNSVFEVAFTVEDPGNAGFELTADSVLASD
ncbi:MAG: hypothetical protein AAGK78_06920, partial [Planctomycetota bacterium]